MRVLVLDRLVPRSTVVLLGALVVLLGAVAYAGVGPLALRLVPVGLALGLAAVVARQRVRLEVTGDDVVLEHRRLTTGRVRLRDADDVHVTATAARDGATVALHVAQSGVRTTALLARLAARDLTQPPEVLQVLADGLDRNPLGDAREVSQLLRLQLEHRASGLPLRLSPLALLVPDQPRTRKRWPA